MRYLRPAVFSSPFVRLAFALPAPQGVSGPVDPSQVINQPTQPVASGSFRGPESLLGYDASNPISTDSTVIPPSDFALAPGQSEDADLGLYIDLKDVENPQPIRGGTTGPTEPGPRFARSQTCFTLLTT